jgi:subfamily B ATP-binding cassette protein MsbA
MKTLKKYLESRLSSFTYFYRKLRWKIFLKTFLNINVGILDGLGLAMFLPY